MRWIDSGSAIGSVYFGICSSKGDDYDMIFHLTLFENHLYGRQGTCRIRMVGEVACHANEC